MEKTHLLADLIWIAGDFEFGRVKFDVALSSTMKVSSTPPSPS